MAKEVYANGREISAKKSGDLAISIPTDVCYTPPPPPPTPKIGVPIPYPNFSKPSSLTNASKTVKIKGNPVSKKNKSYYKNSNGNDPATTQFMKGVVSSQITGKCYSASWSFDVKIEGKNVVRFMDQTKHNA